MKSLHIFQSMIHHNRPILKYISNILKETSQLTLADVVLILVEVRRYIETYQLHKKYSLAKFYCDWALHSETHKNPHAHYALNLINQRFRNSNLPFENLDAYNRTIPDAIKIEEAKGQIETILNLIIGKSVQLDNSFMMAVLKCFIRIPIIQSDDKETQKELEKIDKEIESEIIKWNQQCPKTILTNMIAAKENQKHIVNFEIVDVLDDGVIQYEFMQDE